jgi:hypothetical protein
LADIENATEGGEYQQLFEVAQFADEELGMDLWLLAERLMLFRLTRAAERKRYELASLVHAIHEIKSQSQGEASVPSKIVALDDSGSEGFRGSGEANLTEVFSTVVDSAEQMSYHELYRLISLLRKMEGPKFEPVDVAPFEKAQEFLSQGTVGEDQPWNPLDE